MLVGEIWFKERREKINVCTYLIEQAKNKNWKTTFKNHDLIIATTYNLANLRLSHRGFLEH